MNTMQRFHPLTLVFDFANFLKSFAILVFVVALNIGSDSWLSRIGRILLVVSIIFTIVGSVLKWVTRKYAVDELAFHLQNGLVEKTERTVYFDKIQNVQRYTSFLHKLFGVTSITFETGTSGMNSNVKFDVLKRAEADRLESLVKEFVASDEKKIESGVETETVPKRIVHFTPTRKDTIKASFTSFSFLIILVIGVSLFSKINRFFDAEERVEGWLASILTSGWVIAGIAIVLILVSVGIGMLVTFVRYGKYEIASDENRIYIAKGVLDETAFSTLKSRVQAVEITQSFMKRVLGLAEVKLISAGDLGDDEDEVSTLYPFLPVKRAYSIISELLPGYEISLTTTKLPKKALWARLIKPYWFWLIATVFLTYFRPEIFRLHYGWLLVSVVFLILLAVGRILNYFNTNYALTDQFIQLSEGTFGKTTLLTSRHKVIEVSVKRTKIQQWMGLATIGIINRAKPVRHDSLADVPIMEAKRFYAWYAKRMKEVQLK